MTSEYNRATPELAGVDGCKAGWIALVEHATGEVEPLVVTRIEDLFEAHPHLSCVAIDIPIGLTDAGNRRCDEEAKALLGARHRSVFHAPKRRWLAAEGHAAAVAIARTAGESAPSIQSWCITPKIRAVDDALRGEPELRNRVMEVHPELCFRAMAGAPMKAGKETPGGWSERLSIIARHFGQGAFEEVRSKFLRKHVADDDILDAFAALWTARRIASGRAEAIPKSEQIDAVGLPMRISF